MAIKKTTEEFRQELLLKYPELVVLGEYSGAHTPITIGCAFGHSWQVSPTNILNRGSRSVCNDCVPTHYTRRVVWTESNLSKLRQLCSTSSSLEDISKYFCCTTTAINNACATYKIPRPKFNAVLVSLYTILLEQNREIVSDMDDITHRDVKIDVICSKGHTHSQNVYNIVDNNTGCPSCFSAEGISRGEKELVEYVKSLYKGTIIYNDRKILEGKELDIYLPELNLALEYNGAFWHSESTLKTKAETYHLNKTSAAEGRGIQLLHINEDEWFTKQNIVKSRIASILGVSNKVYARKGYVKVIPFPRDFLNTNHLQGAGTPSKYNLGFFIGDEMYAVMTFSTPKFSKDYDFELVRYCSKLDTSVIGGASKLLKAFRKTNLGSIVTYADRRYSTGGLYYSLGFTLSHISKPNYRYYKKFTSLSRYDTQKHKLKELLPIFDESLSEAENLKANHYHKVYDSGNLVFSLL